MNTVYTFSNGVHVDSSTIEKIKKAYFEIVKKELPEEALNFEVNDFILEEIKTQIKNKKKKIEEDAKVITFRLVINDCPGAINVPQIFLKGVISFLYENSAKSWSQINLVIIAPLDP